MLRYRPTELLAVDEENFEVEIVDIDATHKAVIIDNFYKNPYEIREFILSTPVPIWKNTHDGLNWKEYYDCRHQLLHFDNAPWAEAIYRLIIEHYTPHIDPFPSPPFITNVFQWIVDQPKNSVGNRVHADGRIELFDKEGKELETADYEGSYAANIFFNTPNECHGGTAIYKSKMFNSIFVEGMEKEYIEYMEGGDVHRGEVGAQYYDTEWEKFWTIQKILPMKFNRCVMYDGGLFHGAYHVDNNFKKFPRLGQAVFTKINPEITAIP